MQLKSDVFGDRSSWGRYGKWMGHSGDMNILYRYSSGTLFLYIYIFIYLYIYGHIKFGKHEFQNNEVNSLLVRNAAINIVRNFMHVFFFFFSRFKLMFMCYLFVSAN
jgi:hypothetical protein